MDSCCALVCEHEHVRGIDAVAVDMKLMLTHRVDELPVAFLDGGVEEVESLESSRILSDARFIAGLSNILIDHGVDRIEALTDLFVERVGWCWPLASAGD